MEMGSGWGVYGIGIRMWLGWEVEIIIMYALKEFGESDLAAEK